MRGTGAIVRTMAVGLATLALSIGVPGSAARAADRNACGCYQTEGGSCYCDKKAKCGCPGECEPKGCEEKRQKEMEKEIHAETKRAQETERSRGGKGAGAASDNTVEKAAPAGKPLSAAQVKELTRLLEQHVAAHPGDGGKTVEQLVRELAGAAK